MSHLTTHVLDTATGKPAAGIEVKLKVLVGGKSWTPIASGVTNNDGRIPNLLPDERVLEPSVYKLVFETQEYFERLGSTTFYPFVPVIFEITDQSHYHVPLLLSPYGYSTYRGS